MNVFFLFAAFHICLCVVITRKPEVCSCAPRQQHGPGAIAAVGAGDGEGKQSMLESASTSEHFLMPHIHKLRVTASAHGQSSPTASAKSVPQLVYLKYFNRPLPTYVAQFCMCLDVVVLEQSKYFKGEKLTFKWYHLWIYCIHCTIIYIV